MKAPKTGNVRTKGNQEKVWNNRPDTVVLTSAPLRIWDTLKLFHPHTYEILSVVRVLNRMGAKRSIIAAALGLQGWQNFCGVCEWTTEDVKDILQVYNP